MVNAVWSATKTRQYHLESRTRMLFRRGAIRGHSTVANPIARPIRAVLPACKEPAIVGSRRVSATMHKCATCGRAFTRRDHLQLHASRCRPNPFVCDVCNSSFGRKDNIDRHKRTVQCGGPPQPVPAPKRRRIVASLNEDPVLAPPVEHAANDELSSAIRDFVHENWASVRTHVVNGPVQTRYNRRLTSLDTRDLHDQLFLLFDQQTTAFKINASYGFLLKEKESGRFRYYHSSNNCCGRLLEEPSLITNRTTSTDSSHASKSRTSCSGLLPSAPTPTGSVRW